MNSFKKLGRAESVVSGGTSIPPGQLGPSGAGAGDDPSPRQQSPIRHPQPLSAAGAGGPVDRVGNTSRSFSPVSARGASQPKGKRPGKAKLTSGAGAVPKKGRLAKRGSVPDLTVPTPDLYTGQLQPEGLPLHGAARPVPTGIGARGRSTVRPTRPCDSRFRFGGSGPVSVGQSAQCSSGLAYYEGHTSSSGFTRCSGVPVSQVSSQFSSATTRGRMPKKTSKKSRRSRRSASSSWSSGRSHRCKRRRCNDSLSRAEFLEAFQSLAASLSGRPGGSDLGPPASASYAPQPVSTGHGWVTPAQTGLPHTVSRAPASPPAISLHPSAHLESDLDSLSGRHVDAAPPALTGSLSETSRPARSDASAELTRVQRLSISETELRLVQRDMIRVLGLPPAAEHTPPEHPSFKRKSGPTSGTADIFSTMPLDCVCVDRIADIMGTSKWSAFSPRVDKYYRFPTEDFDKYFATPTVPDSAKDKLATDRGSASSKLPFADKTRGLKEIRFVFTLWHVDDVIPPPPFGVLSAWL